MITAELQEHCQHLGYGKIWSNIFDYFWGYHLWTSSHSSQPPNSLWGIFRKKKQPVYEPISIFMVLFFISYPQKQTKQPNVRVLCPKEAINDDKISSVCSLCSFWSTRSCKTQSQTGHEKIMRVSLRRHKFLMSGSETVFKWSQRMFQITERVPVILCINLVSK